MTVVGVLRPTGEAVTAPAGDTVLEPGTVLVALGPDAGLDQLKTLATTGG